MSSGVKDKLSGEKEELEWERGGASLPKMCQSFVASAISGGGEEGKRLFERTQIKRMRAALLSAALMAAVFLYEESITSMGRSQLLLVRGVIDGDNDYLCTMVIEWSRVVHNT